MEPGPRVLAVLFADVSGSTSLYEALGDRAALAAVESVLNILKRAVAAHQGRVVKTIGDEVMAVFEGRRRRPRRPLWLRTVRCTI